VNRIPPLYWVIGLVAGIGALVWIKKRGATGSPGTATGAPSFTQAQETQDFQIFSALTSQQQASDLNMVSELAGLFSGGSSTGTGSGGGSGSPSPPSTGAVPPTVQSAYTTGVERALGPPGASGAPPASSADLASLSGALNSTPPSQRGALENFWLWNQANQQSGYDYFNPAHQWVTTPLGAAPGE
jgi:hypothetical protein